MSGNKYADKGERDMERKRVCVCVCVCQSQREKKFKLWVVVLVIPIIEGGPEIGAAIAYLTQSGCNISRIDEKNREI